MMKYKRIFLIVLDSFGIGEMPDAASFGDEGSNTLRSVSSSRFFRCETMKKLGLFNIDGTHGGTASPKGVYARLSEASRGKDTTTGHWEICSLVSEKSMPVFPDGFPKEIIDEFSKRTGRGVLCNKPYSGTDVIRDYGKEHLETGALIVYTSADSVFQIAAHEKEVSREELYRYCRIAREILTGEYAVGRVIARPFDGEEGSFYRTDGRHDFSLEPFGRTTLDILKDTGFDVISVGKIYDIFASRGITESHFTSSNSEGMKITAEIAKKDFTGLCFVNLVDFDMKYGHRNDIDGYAKAFSEFDEWLGGFIETVNEDDLIMITADHGCDPATESTDHSREYVPLVCYSQKAEPKNLGTLNGFYHIGHFIEKNFTEE